MVSKVNKRIGNTIYHYEVTYIPETKKQKWKYIGKTYVGTKVDISKLFTDVEIFEIKRAYEMTKEEMAKESIDKSQRDDIKLILDAIELLCGKVNIKI